jgi:hypothetical protein
MNKLIRKSTGTVLGLALALVSVGPALADDTELLLVAPPEPSQLKPNVMFILDTSGSMGDVQTTGQPFNPATDYSAFGTCDPNNLYWGDGTTTPVCDADNTRFIAKGAWHCDDASIQIAGVGAYTGVLVQYRSNCWFNTGQMTVACWNGSSSNQESTSTRSNVSLIAHCTVRTAE